MGTLRKAVRTATWATEEPISSVVVVLRTILQSEITTAASPNGRCRSTALPPLHRLTGHRALINRASRTKETHNRRQAMDTSSAAFEPLISAHEAGRLLGIHPVTVLRWAREGRVPHRRIGRRVAFRTSELNQWVATLYTGTAVSVTQP